LLTILISLPLINSNAANAGNPNCWWASIWKTIECAKDVTPENDAFYRNLLKEAGLNNVASIIIGTWPDSKNAGISPLGPLLIIDETYFSATPLDQQRFIIGHEAVHLQNAHGLKRVGGLFCVFLLQPWIQTLVGVLHYELVRAIKNERLKRSLNSTLVRSIVHAGTFACTFLLPMAMLSWHCEFEADREGATVLDCVQGGIGLLQRWESESIKKMDTASGLTFLKAACKRYFWNRLSHPPFSWRIAELEKLA
jgi:hypothetical protein